MAKVKCRYCGKSIDKKIAVAVPHGRTNYYYCPEHVGQKPPKELFYEELRSILPSTNTIIYKEMEEISKIHGYEKMLSYLQDNKNYLNNVMNNKSFSSDYGRCKYFVAILKNNLGDYQPKQSAPVIKKETNIEIYEPKKVVRKQQRQGMDDLLNDLLD